MAATEYRLVPLTEPGNRAREQAVLRPGVSTLGRAVGNSILLDDDQVSKRHARIHVDGTAVVIEDLQSSNGTFVNGEPVEACRLAPGDVVEVGGSRFELVVGDKPAARVTLVGGDQLTQFLTARPVEPFDPDSRIDSEARLRREYERLRVAWSAVQELTTSSDPQAICRRAAEAALALVRAESAVVLLRGGNGKLSPYAARSLHGTATRLVVSRTILERVVEQREAVLASDALLDERFGPTESIILSSARSIMAVPLIKNDQILGVLHASSSDTAAFTERDLDLLAGVGSGAAVALANVALNRRLESEAKTRSALERFLSPALVEQVMRQHVQLLRTGANADVTVLFADIRGFTSLTERSDAASVVALLNEYFEQMVDVVFTHNGVLDKLIGDALMAVWGTPLRRDDDAAHALAAARDMHATLAALNTVRRDRGDQPLAIGVGLASGSCVAGAIGSRRRLDYTVIGDSVNLASRLAGLAKPGEIVCDESTFSRSGCPEDAELSPPTPVKGKSAPVRVYRIRTA